MLEVLGWLILLVGVGVSIGLHEIGHLVPAKRFGVRVTQYMVGFGPTIWSRRRGETEYGIKAVPLGGYIRMIGMYPPERDGAHEGRFATLIADARAASAAEIGPDDHSRQFWQLPVRKRVVIMLGGPFMNLLLALFFFAITISAIGISTASTTVAAISSCTPTAQNLAGTADEAGDCIGTSDSPAYTAGLRRGDVVTSVGGTSVSTWPQAQDAIRAAGPGPVALVVDRNGTPTPLLADLASAPRPTVNSCGRDGDVEVRPFLGVQPTFTRETQPLTSVPGFVGTTSFQAVCTLATFPVRVWDLVKTITTDQPRDPNGVVGVVGVGRITGEVVALDNTPVLDKAATVFGILAGLNLFLFLFNLVPLLPLDGGHIAGALWEGLRRRLARLRGRADPGPVDVARGLPVAYAVSIALIAVSVVILYADLVKPITLQ